LPVSATLVEARPEALKRSAPDERFTASVSLVGSARRIASVSERLVSVTDPAPPVTFTRTAPAVPFTVTASAAASPAPLTPRSRSIVVSPVPGRSPIVVVSAPPSTRTFSVSTPRRSVPLPTAT
jgi:hypothetical protein